MLVQFPRRQRRPLVARARLIDPDMDRQPGVVRHENRCEGGAPIDACQPARVAMSQHVQLRSGRFLRQHFAKNREAVTADRLVHGDILIAQFGRTGVSRFEPLGRRQLRHRGLHLVERPLQVDRGGPGLVQRLVGRGKPRVAGIIAQGEANSVSRRGPDERRTPDGHVADRLGAIFHRAQRQRLELMRKKPLVDHVNGAGCVVVVAPDRAPAFALVIHFRIIAAKKRRELKKSVPW